ncbi:MAG: glucosaminidase domain-containing protein [Bacteroidales bacterium]|nr:glucosaminidase domain-containing protein [Bacteroidales bacterium]
MQIGAEKSYDIHEIVGGTSLRAAFVELSYKAFNNNSLMLRAMSERFDTSKLHERGSSLKLISKGVLTKGRMISFLSTHNRNLDLLYVEKIVDLYLLESSHEGINHDLAFVQMCHETGFMRFTGDVKASQFNFCGLGAIGNNEPGLSFNSAEEGIRAHIQHLKAYASLEELSSTPVYNRIRFVKRGMAPSLHDLTGKWATDQLYGQKIESLLGKAYDGSFLLRGS